MTDESTLALRRLFKKIAMACLLLAMAALAWIYFVGDPNLQAGFVGVMLIASGAMGYRQASTAALWTASPWLKGLLRFLGVLAGAATFAAAVALGTVSYLAISGSSSSGGSSHGGFSSRSFD